MSHYNQAKKWFYEAVRMSNCDPELRDKLLHGTHPRVDTFLKNLEAQINSAKVSYFFKNGVPFDEITVKNFVYDLTNIFLKMIETEAKRRYESDLSRLAREARLQEIKDMDSTLAGKAAGAFEEMGVLIDETRQDQTLTQKA